MSNLIHSVLPNPKRPLVTIEPKLTVKACVNLMLEQDIGALVVRSGKELLGMVTERDIVRNCICKELDPEKAEAQDIIFKNVSILSSHDPVEKAMETITRTKRRHVLIEEDGELIAILSIGDLLYHLLDDKTRVIEHLENYIHS